MYKQNHTPFFTFVIFAFVGIGLIVNCFQQLKKVLEFKADAVEVVAVITNISGFQDNDGGEFYDVYIDYSINGKSYNNVPLREYRNDMYEGKEITILCRSDQPRHIMSTTYNYMSWILQLGMGILVVLLGIVPIIINLMKKSLQNKLLDTGTILHATVEDIVFNTSCSYNNRHPYNIYCSYKDEYLDITYRFKSNNLWIDPSYAFPVGSTINVHVDPNDYSKYYVNADCHIYQRIVDYT